MTRPHFEPGGGAAHLWYAVPGPLDTSAPMSASRYQSRGVPAGCTLERHDGGLLDEWPVWTSRGMRSGVPVEAADCLVLRGQVEDPPDLEYLQDAVGLICYLLDCGGLGVYDPHLLRWWEPDSWRSQQLPESQAGILVSGDWYHTRGMIKFGRPDLSVRGVGPGRHQAVVEMIQRFIALQALGGQVPEGQPIRMAGLPPGGVARHGGSLDDPDFNNVHLELCWPKGALI